MKRVEALGGDPNALDQKRSVLGNVPDLLKIELISAKQFVEEIGKFLRGEGDARKFRFRVLFLKIELF